MLLQGPIVTPVLPEQPNIQDMPVSISRGVDTLIASKHLQLS